jgi:hypothetical protein
MQQPEQRSESSGIAIVACRKQAYAKSSVMLGGLAYSTAKGASSSQSKERTGNGYASNRPGVALSRTRKAANSQSFLLRNSSFQG